MHDIIQSIFNITMISFVAGIMITLGLGVKTSDVIEQFKETRLVIFSVIANFIAVPLFALALVSFFDASKGVSIGIILLSLGAGAPFIPKIVQTAKGNTYGSIGLMLLLSVISILFMPIIIPIIFSDASVSSLQIANSLLFTMLIPLMAGMIINAYYPLLATKLLPWTNKISNLSVVLLIFALIYLYTDVIISHVSVIPIIVVFFLGSMAIGYLSAGKNKTAKISLSVGTGLRNPPIAMLVASEHFSSEPVAGIIALLMVIIGLSILFPLAKFIGKQSI